MEERIQKILSARGVASRRAAEKMIEQGRITVNGVRAALGDRADASRDMIMIDGKPLGGKKDNIYIMLNKPRGYITTVKDERDRKTVLDLIDLDERVYPIGRLDCNSEGLLLLTNDGELTNKLTHPSHSVGKQYIVKVKGDVDTALTRLRLPFVLDGKETAPAQVQVLREDPEGGLISIIIHEGRNRQIRRMCEESELDVVRLKRVAVGALTLEKLPIGRWRYLTDDEIAYLKGL